MDHALLKIGLPVTCAFADCKLKGFVKPHNYGGWHKSQMYRTRKKHWYCPEHAATAQEWDDRFYGRYETPEPVIDIEPEEVKDATQELYDLLD